MAYDIVNAIADFETLELDEFGESITYYENGSATGRSLQACIYRREKGALGLPDSTMSPTRTKIQMKISRGATLGVEDVVRGVDKVKFLVSPDDAFEKTMVVHSVDDEFGCWMLGLM